MFNFILNYKDRFERLFDSTSHAILLNSADTVLCENLAKLYAMNLCCKQTQKPCGICSCCLKIISNNSLDTLIYPKGTNLLMEDISDLLDKINIIPAENEYKVVIIKNFDDASLLIQNKLLKTLEEPPKFVKILLLAKSVSKVIPTIVSRCEVISPSKFDNNDLMLLLDGVEKSKAQILMENCNGSITLLEQIKQESNFFDNYNMALDLLLNFVNSKQILDFSIKLSQNKQNFVEILTIFNNFLFDIVKINCKNEDVVQNKFSLEKLKKASLVYTTKACLNIQKEINLVFDKIKYNGNLSGIVDSFLLKILEEKWQNKK